MNPAGTFRHGHEDLVQSIHYNFYGDRLVTGSSDHRIKVWNRKPDGEFELVDTWRGHDAEVMEVVENSLHLTACPNIIRRLNGPDLTWVPI